MENLERFKHDYEANGGTVVIRGLENHQSLSNHPLSSKKNKKGIQYETEKIGI